MVHQLRAQATLAEDTDAISSIHWSLTTSETPAPAALELSEGTALAESTHIHANKTPTCNVNNNNKPHQYYWRRVSISHQAVQFLL